MKKKRQVHKNNYSTGYKVNIPLDCLVRVIEETEIKVLFQRTFLSCKLLRLVLNFQSSCQGLQCPGIIAVCSHARQHSAC